MVIHWPSFLIGIATPVVAVAAALLLARIVSARRALTWKAGSSGPVPAGFEPLRFTPHLIGQLRRPLQSEDHAQAS